MENSRCVLQEWAVEADLDEHLQSEKSRILRGAVRGSECEAGEVL